MHQVVGLETAVRSWKYKQFGECLLIGTHRFFTIPCLLEHFVFTHTHTPLQYGHGTRACCFLARFKYQEGSCCRRRKAIGRHDNLMLKRACIFEYLDFEVFRKLPEGCGDKNSEVCWPKTKQCTR